MSHDGGLELLWHGDAGYETGDAGLPGPRHRAVLDGQPLRHPSLSDGPRAGLLADLTAVAGTLS